MNTNEISKFGDSHGVGQEIIKIIESGKLVRWISFNPQTREYEALSTNGAIKIHESKTTKQFSAQEELNFRRSESSSH